MSSAAENAGSGRQPARSGRSGTAAAQLLQVAGPDLYRRNPFRITGLATDTSGREVRESKKRVSTALAVGASVPGDSRLPLPKPATPDQILAAFDALGDPQRRLVSELFWFWGSPVAACGCSNQLHNAHDSAVRTHARALDLELSGRRLSKQQQAERDRLWADAASRWTRLLVRPELWDHVRHRMDALNDRRLDDSTIAALRETMPRALVTTIVELAAAADSPARLAGLATRWRVKPGLVDDMLGEAAARMLERVEATTTQALDDLRGGDAHGAAQLLKKEALPLLKRVDQLVGDKPNQEVANTKDGVAIAFNNCATALMDSPGGASSPQISQWLDVATKLAVAADTRKTVSKNANSLNEDEKVRDALRPFGVGLGNDGMTQYGDHIVALAKRGEFTEALEILDAIRPLVTDPEFAASIDKMDADLRRLRRNGGVVQSERSTGCLAMFGVFSVTYGVVFALAMAFGSNPVLAAIIALFLAIMSLGFLN